MGEISPLTVTTQILPRGAPLTCPAEFPSAEAACQPSAKAAASRSRRARTPVFFRFLEASWYWRPVWRVTEGITKEDPSPSQHHQSRWAEPQRMQTLYYCHQASLTRVGLPVSRSLDWGWHCQTTNIFRVY